MSDDHSIDPTVRRRIDTEIARIETERGVRVLLAVESGSRAWGFPSPDSDYDVRFIYVRPLTDYLALFARPDVIEQPIAEGLDISGWDLRKALQLAVRSNAVLIEWLASPVRYRDEIHLTAQLREVVHAAAHLPALEYHYDRIAQRVFAEITATDGPVRLKRYFYALRPALALRWLRRYQVPPPMDLRSLMTRLDVPDAVAQAVDELLARKARAAEAATTARLAVVDAYLGQTLSQPVPPPREKPDMAAFTRLADRFLVSVLETQ